jgi:type IV pilus assembly protein PilY1
MTRTRLRRLVGLFAAFVAVVPGAEVASAGVISQIPLHSGIQVEPNILFIVDDSGSMDSEVLFPSNDGALWWNTSDKSFVGRDRDDGSASGVLNYNSIGSADATWKKYVYLFPNGTDHGARVYADSTHDHYAIPPIAPYAFARSADYNGMYYDYRETYEPWPSSGTDTFPGADSTAAPSDPARGSGTLDLTTDLTVDAENWTFRLQPGMVLPAGTEYDDGDG